MVPASPVFQEQPVAAGPVMATVVVLVTAVATATVTATAAVAVMEAAAAVVVAAVKEGPVVQVVREEIINARGYKASFFDCASG